MSRIYRYEVPVDDQWHEFPELNGDIIHVAARNPAIVEFWAEHFEVGEQHSTIANGFAYLNDGPRRFRVYGTGHPLPSKLHAMVHGTAIAGPLVWHLVEGKPSWMMPEPTG